MKTPLPAPPDLAPRPGKTAPAFKGDGWWTIQEACEYFDIPDIRRLRGWIFRNRWGDPLGNPMTGTVYPITLERYLRRVEKLSAETGAKHVHHYVPNSDSPAGYECECGEMAPYGWYPDTTP